MSKALAKILISGEHSVVYGAPALGMTLDDYFTISQIQDNHKNEIECRLESLKLTQTIKIEELLNKKNKIQERYSAFLSNELKIEEVLIDKFSMIYFLIKIFVEKNNIELKKGFILTVNSNIPIGAHIGSSAAFIVSILRSLEEYFKINPSQEVFLALARMTENLQHGHSSGIDIKIIMHGGIIYLENNKIYVSKKLPCRYLIVNSGTPESTTGACVNHAKQFFTNKLLLQEFANTTSGLNEAIVKDNAEQFQAGIRKNHRLLVNIGVVPQKIQDFVLAIEELGESAKTTGAGSIKGDTAGCLLVLYKDDNSFVQIKEICDRFGYFLYNL